MSANPVTHPPVAEPAMLLSAAETVPADWHRLADYLRAHGMSFDPDQPIRQFAGGLANRNYLVVVDGVRAVLRRPPDGDLPPGAHDMAREHKIFRASPPHCRSSRRACIIANAATSSACRSN